MKLTTTTFVSVDGVMQGVGGPDEDRSGGFKHGGWTTPLWDNEAGTFLNHVYQRAAAPPRVPARGPTVGRRRRSSREAGRDDGAAKNLQPGC
jgi:hypothetical protein